MKLLYARVSQGVSLGHYILQLKYNSKIVYSIIFLLRKKCYEYHCKLKRGQTKPSEIRSIRAFLSYDLDK